MIGALIIKRMIRGAFQALNRHDIDTFLKNWHDDGTFIYPSDIMVSGTHEGKTAIRSWFENFFDLFPTIEFTVKHVAVKNIFDVTGSNVAIAEWDIKVTKKDGFSAANSGVSVIVTRMGKVIYVKDYIFDTGEVWRKGWGAEP